MRRLPPNGGGFNVRSASRDLQPSCCAYFSEPKVLFYASDDRDAGNTAAELIQVFSGESQAACR